jgi:hypothetical protein
MSAIVTLSQRGAMGAIWRPSSDPRSRMLCSGEGWIAAAKIAARFLRALAEYQYASRSICFPTGLPKRSTQVAIQRVSVSVMTA